jgi:protein-L-isoaspartate(D-aspartate) O-methyltransferase
MQDAPDESLTDLVARVQKTVGDARRTGDPVAIVSAANAGADLIELRIGQGRTDADRAALTAVKRFTFNAAADCWPGWSLTGPSTDAGNLITGLELARRSARLVEELSLGSLQQGTATWLSGAFELALGRLDAAAAAFRIARQQYHAAEAPGLALLMEGYEAIAARIGGQPGSVDEHEFAEVCARIESGGFEDGQEWIEQLHTALKVFTSDLRQARRRFANEIQQLGQIRSTGLIEGLATVPRESFMGPGPWKIVRAAEMAKGYQVTPDSNPLHLYENVLVALDERRMLNNGEPVALLLFLDSLTLSAGDRFLHIGCGVGYYTAIATYAIGARGAVVAVEIDAELAARAKQNLRPYPMVAVVADDGSLGDFGSFDAIFVNAGCTRPLPLWLDQLAVGGRLLMPLTVSLPTSPNLGAGSMLLVIRGQAGYSARLTSPVGIFHCEGARSPEGEALLAKALAAGDRESVCRLRRDAHEPGADCWLHAPDFCLESDPALRRGRRELTPVA